MTLRVCELFYSIQGESTHSGRPSAFIRLSGCNLRCTWCDTTYAYDEGTDLCLEDIVEQAESCSCDLITITGGEPLLQDETPELVRRLLDRRHSVVVETNGSVDVSVLDGRCTRIMDVKCPSSGESESLRPENLKHLTPRDEIKFVIADRRDYEYAQGMLRRIRRDFSDAVILFSPVAGMLDPAGLAEWILEDHLDVRLNLQLHKVLWPDAERGR